MRIDVQYRPAYSLAVVQLDAGEAIHAESGAMVSFSEGVAISTGLRGGLLGALERKVLGGESFWQNTFTAEAGPGEVTLAPGLPGDVLVIELERSGIVVQSSSYLAAGLGVDVDTKWGGARAFFSREGLFMLRAEGTGPVLVSSYGAIHCRELAAGEVYTVDTGHMVAFDASVDYAVRTVGGLKSSTFSGEGLVCRYTGPGRVWIQTRSEDAFLSWLIPQIPIPRQTSS